MAMISGYTGPRRSWTERVVAAGKLDISLYEEVEADTSATMQAAGVVAVAAVAQAIGASGEGVRGIVVMLFVSLVGWAIWAGITYLVGAKVFKGTANWGELARTLGFAQAPRILSPLGLVPFIGGLLEWLIGVWVLVAGVIAIRQALDISTGKAIVTTIIGWLVVVIPPLLLGGAFALFGR